MDFYALLQVAPDADREVIRAAFCTIMNRLAAHPDKGGNNENAQRLIEAWQTLSDDGRRRDYDRQRLKTAHHFPLRFATRPKGAIKPVAFLPARPGVHERRRSPRLPVRLTAYAHLRDSRVCPATIDDISLGGVRLRLRLRLAIGDSLELSVAEGGICFARGEIGHIRIAGLEYGLRWTKLFDEHMPRGALKDLFL